MAANTEETSARCQEVGIKKINYTGSDHSHKARQELKDKWQELQQQWTSVRTDNIRCIPVFAGM